MADDVEKRSAKQWRKRARPKREYRVEVRFGDDEISAWTSDAPSVISRVPRSSAARQ